MREPVVFRRAGRSFRLAAGEPGPGPALALAVIALLGAFVAMAGPRELTSLQNDALRQTLASAGSLGISATDEWQLVGSSAPTLTSGQVQVMADTMGSYLHPPLVSPAAQQWAGLSTPFRPVVNPAPQAILGGPPLLEIAYRDVLTSHARLVSGSLPDAATSARRAGQQVIVLQAAVTAATAARFGLRPGSQVLLGSISSLPPTDPPAVLSVTGVLRPTDPASSFWTQDPSLAAPTTLQIGQVTKWVAGVFVGPGELAALQAVDSGANISLTWEFPLVTRDLTAAQAPGMLTTMTSLASGNAGAAAQQAAGPPVLNPPAISANGAGTLSAFLAGQAAVGNTESLLLAGIVAATAILLLVGGAVITDAYAAELTLTRARGGSTGQLAARILGTTAATAGPALIAGALAAIAVVPDGGNPVSWVLVALVAGATMAAPALLVAWQHRGPRSLTAPARGDLVIGRRSVRRLVAEITILIVVAGGVLAVRLRGLAPGAGFDPYLSSAPVGVAVAAGLIAARLYPVPLRLLLRITAARRGPVGYLGIARSARSRAVPLLPALALVVALTVIALGGLVRAAVSRGQVTASWQQVGADALVQSGGSELSVTPAAQRALAAVPGVRLACAVYVISAGSSQAGNLLVGTTGGVSTGVVIADPAQYAALAAGTPWPAFPARELAPPRARAGPGRPGGGIPVIASPSVAAAIRSGTSQLAFASSQLTIRVAATVGSTPAIPGGGSFVILPAWAASELKADTAPNTVLLMGTAINTRDLRAVAARVAPGSQVVSRAAVLAAAAGSPLVHGSDLVFDESVAAAIACAVAAVLLGLLLSGREENRLSAWLTAMGMTARQRRRLALLDALPLLLVAIGGAEIAGAVLGPLIGPGLDLSVFTGSNAPVPLQPDAVALIAPAVGAVVLVTAVAVGRSVLARGRIAATLRLDEGR
jgi:putative ABC transport system permease protein